MTQVDETRTLELLADRATVGLGTEEQAELDAQLAARPELDADSFELAAAAIELAYTDVSQPLPPALRQRLLGRAEDFYGALPAPPDGTGCGQRRRQAIEGALRSYRDRLTAPIPPEKRVPEGWVG